MRMGMQMGIGRGRAAGGGGGLTPDYDPDMATAPLDAGLAIVRNTGAIMRPTPGGYFSSVGANVARIGHVDENGDSVTWIECDDGVVNRLDNGFNVGAWTTGSAVITTGVTDLLGGTDAVTLTESSGSVRDRQRGWIADANAYPLGGRVWIWQNATPNAMPRIGYGSFGNYCLGFLDPSDGTFLAEVGDEPDAVAVDSWTLPYGTAYAVSMIKYNNSATGKIAILSPGGREDLAVGQPVGSAAGDCDFIGMECYHFGNITAAQALQRLRHMMPVGLGIYGATVARDPDELTHANSNLSATNQAIGIEFSQPADFGADNHLIALTASRLLAKLAATGAVTFDDGTNTVTSTNTVAFGPRQKLLIARGTTTAHIGLNGVATAGTYDGNMDPAGADIAFGRVPGSGTNAAPIIGIHRITRYDDQDLGAADVADLTS